LLRNGDKQDELNCNLIRQRALLLLCQMNPSQTLALRTNCIEICRLPSLAILLALEDKSSKNYFYFFASGK
jgi:integrator complex subunit 2